MKRLLRENLAAAPGRVWLVTVTAPGSDYLPCSSTTCGAKGEHLQRSADGCRVDERLAALWNRTAARRWTLLHAAASARVRRAGHRPPVLAYVWQLQTRGVLHLHLVLDYGPTGLVGAQQYVKALRALRRRHSFGTIDAHRSGPKSTVMESGRAARYLSPYVSESSQLVRALELDERPRRVVYVARWLNGLTGCTMRRLRRVRFLWWIRQGRSVFAHAGKLPAWFRDSSEYGAVCALARAP